VKGRTLDDLRSGPRAVLRTVQEHKGWDDARAFDWLNSEVYGWTVTLANGGNWIKGEAPNHMGPGIDPLADQILTRAEATTLRRWHSEPWRAMTRESWERWMRARWSLNQQAQLYPNPDVLREIARLDIDGFIQWWPNGRRPKPDDPWVTCGYHGPEDERLRRDVEYRDGGVTPDITALAVELKGRFRILRDAYRDWYEGRYRAIRQAEGQLSLGIPA